MPEGRARPGVSSLTASPAPASPRQGGQPARRPSSDSRCPGTPGGLAPVRIAGPGAQRSSASGLARGSTRERESGRRWPHRRSTETGSGTELLRRFGGVPSRCVGRRDVNPAMRVVALAALGVGASGRPVIRSRRARQRTGKDTKLCQRQRLPDVSMSVRSQWNRSPVRCDSVDRHDSRSGRCYTESA